MVIPAAIPIIFASAIPTCVKRSGNSAMKASIFNEPTKSAHKATTFSFFLPASSKPAPKPERVSFFSVYVYFFTMSLFLTPTPKGDFVLIKNLKFCIPLFQGMKF